MAKKGSKKNPLILRLADESRVELITEICYQNGWQFILGIEPDQEEDLSDLERKLNPPVHHKVIKTGRNEPCTCGSGKKFKKCCGANVQPKSNDEQFIKRPMEIPQNSVLSSYEKSLEKVRETGSEDEYQGLKGAFEYLLLYDLGAKHSPEKLAARLHGKTGHEILSLVKW